jgi:hypothetical protein
MSVFCSQEMSTAHEFLALESQFLSVLGTDPELPSLRPILDGLGSTTLLFGLCELNAKRVVRRSAAKQRTVLTASYADSIGSYNAAGLKSLSDLAARAKKLQNELNQQRVRINAAHIKKSIKDVRHDMGLYLADSNLKEADITKILKALDEVEAAFVAGDKQVGDFISKKISELDALRNSPDRGNRENIPAWKLVIIAVYLAVGLIYAIRCIIQDVCSRNAKAAFYLAALVLGISLKFC